MSLLHRLSLAQKVALVAGAGLLVALVVGLLALQSQSALRDAAAEADALQRGKAD